MVYGTAQHDGDKTGETPLVGRRDTLTGRGYIPAVQLHRQASHVPVELSKSVSLESLLWCCVVLEFTSARNGASAARPASHSTGADWLLPTLVLDQIRVLPGDGVVVVALAAIALHVARLAAWPISSAWDAACVAVAIVLAAASTGCVRSCI